MSTTTVWRLALTSFLFCIVTLCVILALWVGYLAGPEVSVYDLGSPQLRVTT